MPHGDNQTNNTAQAFNDWAGHWDDHYRPEGAMAGRIIRFLDVLNTLGEKPGELLDYGCGTGNISISMANQGWHVTGCDLSAPMLSKAQAADSKHMVNWTLIDAGKSLPLPFAEASFSTVISSSVFEYLSEPQSVIQDIYRLLKPGGWFLFTVPNPAHPERIKEAKKVTIARFAPFWQLIRHTRWASEYRYLRISINRPPVDVWMAMLTDAGLKVSESGIGDDPLAIIMAQKPKN